MPASWAVCRRTQRSRVTSRPRRQLSFPSSPSHVLAGSTSVGTKSVGPNLSETLLNTRSVQTAPRRLLHERDSALQPGADTGRDQVRGPPRCGGGTSHSPLRPRPGCCSSLSTHFPGAATDRDPQGHHQHPAPLAQRGSERLGTLRSDTVVYSRDEGQLRRDTSFLTVSCSRVGPLPAAAPVCRCRAGPDAPPRAGSSRVPAQPLLFCDRDPRTGPRPRRATRHMRSEDDPAHGWARRLEFQAICTCKGSVPRLSNPPENVRAVLSSPATRRAAAATADGPRTRQRRGRRLPARSALT